MKHLNDYVQNDISNWYKDYWKEQLRIKRKARFLKKALKRYKLSQDAIGLIGE